MKVPRVLILILIVFPTSQVFASDDTALQNWAAPPYWSPLAARVDETDRQEPRGSYRIGLEAVAAGAPTPLPFVALPPCRVADTRALSGFPSGYGPPSMPGVHVQRDFTITGRCAIPADAQAVSFNFTVWAPVTRGDIRVFPAGGGTPTVATLNWEANIQALANAAIVPFGTGGAITVQVDGPGTIDLIVDVNGYYSPLGVVNSVNALSGAVTLAGSSTVTIAPAGNTLTFSSTVGAGGVLPTGSAGQTLRSNGTSWLASSALTNDGTNVGVGGNLYLPGTSAGAGQLWLGGGAFLHGYGSSNTFVGTGSGNFTQSLSGNVGVGTSSLSSLTNGYDNVAIGAGSMNQDSSGFSNTAVGRNSLIANTTASYNTAVGAASAQSNTVGEKNTAVGAFSLASNTASSKNTALGQGALASQSFANGGVAFDGNNTAVGFEALLSNQQSSVVDAKENTALGSMALRANTWASYNTGLGYAALTSNTTGTYNTATGYSALFTNVNGSGNTASGWRAMYYSTGQDNTAVGRDALFYSTGDKNIGIGSGAGAFLTSGFENIHIGHSGLSTDTRTIRIGAFGSQLATFIAGIRGRSTGVNDAIAVVIDSAGQLGTVSSSIRFKEEVRDMAEASARLMQLRPVTFRYTAHRGQANAMQFGLIAEEVEEVMPELVARSADGEIETVKYHQLPAMLLNELQKAIRRIEELEKDVASLKAATSDGIR